jgi:hypothetical protein
MIPLFLGLSAVNILCLAISAALGYGVSSGRAWGTYHQLFGALATFVCCAVHCIVFTYFIATAKWVQHAVAVKHLDPELNTPTRSFKAQAFPAALIAMAVVCLTAFVGAATFGYGLRPIYHHALALVCLFTNVIVAIVEYRAIARNGALIDHILATVNPATARG